MCNFAKTLLDLVGFPGPLPRVTWSPCWLSKWCPENCVGFIDNWQTFWRKPGLVRKDGINPTLDGAALVLEIWPSLLHPPIQIAFILVYDLPNFGSFILDLLLACSVLFLWGYCMLFVLICDLFRGDAHSTAPPDY